MGQVKATEWAVPVSFPLGNGQRLVAFPEVSGWAFNSMAMITYDLVGYLVLHSLLVYNKKNMFMVFGFFSNVQYYCVTQWPIVNRSFLFVVVVVVVLFVCFLFVFCLFVFSTSEFPSLSTASGKVAEIVQFGRVYLQIWGKKYCDHMIYNKYHMPPSYNCCFARILNNTL